MEIHFKWSYSKNVVAAAVMLILVWVVEVLFCGLQASLKRLDLSRKMMYWPFLVSLGHFLNLFIAPPWIKLVSLLSSWFLWDFETFCLKTKSHMLFCDKIIREVDQHFNNSIFGLLREVQSVIEDEIIWVFVTKFYLMERKWVTLILFLNWTWLKWLKKVKNV